MVAAAALDRCPFYTVKLYRKNARGKWKVAVCTGDSLIEVVVRPGLTVYNNLYATTVKYEQDVIISHLLDNAKAKRPRVAVGARQKSRELSVKFHLRNFDVDGAPLVQVCKPTFLSALGVKKDRVSSIAQAVFDQGAPRKENRGGAKDTPEMKARKERIQQHIESFQCRSSHYSVKDNPGRKYIRSDLDVSKMHKMFERQNHEQVSYSLYYTVFRGDFNLGFGHPNTDRCATCERYKKQGKQVDLPTERRTELAAEYILHCRRARKFYNELDAVSEDSMSICFEMMENQVLPKTPIGAAYYSRQLHLYIFGVICHKGQNGPQQKDDVFFFMWLERENHNDSNMIASALHHFFQFHQQEIKSKRELRLFSDSAYGQNKNFNVLSMLLADRKFFFPQTDISYTFPVRGHSYLPADRAFGRVVQDIKRLETIALPDQYISILRRHGLVFEYGRDWQAFDFKSETQRFVKQKREFSISTVKRIAIDGSGDKVKVSDSYYGDLHIHGVLKQGRSWSNFRPPVLRKTSTVKEAKKRDVFKLLEDMGASDAVTGRYRDMMAVPTSAVRNSDSDSD